MTMITGGFVFTGLFGFLFDSFKYHSLHILYLSLQELGTVLVISRVHTSCAVGTKRTCILRILSPYYNTWRNPNAAR